MEDNMSVIYDMDGNVIENPDMEKGHIVSEQRIKAHHDAIPEVEEEFEWRVMEGTESIEPGGLMEKVITVPGHPAQDAYDEYETIRVYHPYTEEELAIRNAPSDMERLQAQVLYTAMMTDTLMGGE